MSHSQMSPPKVQAAVRRKEAVDLRVEGKTYREIAQELGVTPTRARQLVAEALAAIEKDTAESAEELRRLELDRLDQLQAGLWEEAAGGNLKAVGAALKIMERRARLVGLDAPTRTENTHGYADLSEMSDAELNEELRRHANVFLDAMAPSGPQEARQHSGT
jgi:transposase-like protein